ncbi:MAG: GDP-mannose pyrophosphatase [Rhizobiales bacterium]|nr:GDP-mannose pyrophosphatase [Hyphomicrobiales bacterium]MBA70998.1 GDP-mannose pyrophosphatase [Hyphomicrobiales bacterium]
MSLPPSSPDVPRVTIRDETLLSDNWGRLTRYQIDYRRSDGRIERQTREVYDRGEGAVILLYDRDGGTVVLTRQFRLPAFVAGEDPELIEACAGLLDAQDPETAIRREAEEETGYRVGTVERLWTAFMTPGSVTERLHFFIAPYEAGMKISGGGGEEAEGEDIEVLEMRLAEALEMVRTGEICDAKTIMLLQHVALAGIMS